MNNINVLPDFPQIKVLIIGDVMLDRYIIGKIERISPEAPVPILQVKKQYHTLGGAGNVAANLAGLGCGKITLLGVYGNDPDGQLLRNILEEKNIGHTLLVDDSRPTITKTRIISKNQQILRIDEEKKHVISKQLRQKILSQVHNLADFCQAVVLSDYGKGVLEDAELVQEIIQFCRQKELSVFVDPKGKNWSKYSRATCITPNTVELSRVMGEEVKNEQDELKEAQKARKKYCFDWVMLTRGAKGIYLSGPENYSMSIPAQEVKEVYDVSGAGDTVIATLTAAVASGLSFPEAAELANLAAGIVIGKIGTQPIIRSELISSILDKGSGFKGKIRNFDAAKFLISNWQNKGQKVVLTNGCFDLLHPGHIHLLHKAKVQGDRLIVALNSDSSVKRLKGNARPILAEKDRAIILAALDCVDLVVIFGEDTPLEVIKSLKPDVLAKGADYSLEEVVGRDMVESYGGKVILIDILNGYSTSQMTKKINNG